MRQFHPGIEGVDHNNIKGYMSVHYVKEMTERIGGFDRLALADQLHCATITVDDEPGVLARRDLRRQWRPRP